MIVFTGEMPPIETPVTLQLLHFVYVMYGPEPGAVTLGVHPAFKSAAQAPTRPVAVPIKTAVVG